MHGALAHESIASPTRSPPSQPSKAALKYLEASGAIAINISEAGAIKAGKAPVGIVTFWVMAGAAKALCRRARRHAGENPDTETATKALHQAARDLRVRHDRERSGDRARV
jgi:hypothetical protein